MAILAAAAPSHTPGFQTVIFPGFPRVCALSIHTSGSLTWTQPSRAALKSSSKESQPHLGWIPRAHCLLYVSCVITSGYSPPTDARSHDKHVEPFAVSVCGGALATESVRHCDGGLSQARTQTLLYSSSDYYRFSSSTRACCIWLTSPADASLPWRRRAGGQYAVPPCQPCLRPGSAAARTFRPAHRGSWYAHRKLVLDTYVDPSI